MATVVVTNQSADDVTVGGITFANGANNIDSDTLLLLAELDLVDSVKTPSLYYDLSGMEP
jgi:hypothetical protein